MRSASFLPFLVVVAAADLVAAQSPADSTINPWCDYHMGTLRQVLDSGAKILPGDPRTLDRLVLWHSPYRKVRTYLVYWGHPQPMDSTTGLFLDYATRDTTWRRSYHTHLTFTEAGAGLLLLVSDTLTAALRSGVAPGDTLWSFVTVHGLVPGPGAYWVITLDEFGTSSEVTEWGSILRMCQRRSGSPAG